MIERAKAIALRSIRMKHCATNGGWADAGSSSQRHALRIFFLAEAAVKDPYETLERIPVT
jgi:hypothetical protein